MAFNGNRASQLYIAFLFALYHTCSINIYSFTQLPVNFSDVFHVQNAINMVTIPWFKFTLCFASYYLLLKCALFISVYITDLTTVNGLDSVN